MPTQIKLPNLGENVESGDVLTIFVSEGDTVKADQDLLEIETEKATMPIPAPQAGKITKVLVKEGDTIEVGAPFMEIEASGAAEKSAPSRPAAHSAALSRAARPWHGQSRGGVETRAIGPTATRRQCLQRRSRLTAATSRPPTPCSDDLHEFRAI